MSTLKIEVVEILDIKPHSNADRLELVKVKGWYSIVSKGKYQVGDPIIYIPVDSILPLELSDRLNVTKYLSKGRVRAAKIRGVVSYGLIMENEENWEVGTDLTKHYNITKFEPPTRIEAGESTKRHPLLITYTDIENIKNFPTLFQDDEEIIATEKIHGTNCLHGIVINDDDSEEFIASSHRVQRKEDPKSTYWRTFDEKTKNLLRKAVQGHRSAFLYKEVYGSKIQHLNYGLTDTISDIAFDLAVDGHYLDYDDFKELCDEYKISTVPVLYRGTFDRERLDDLVNNKQTKTTLGQASHIMEGIVIKPTKERWSEKTGHRVILKWISDAYALDKKATDFH